VLRAADVYVFPSLHEGLPVALMEAMAAGLPCVASDVRGCSDLILPEEGGFLMQPMDHREMAAAITELLGDEAMRSRMGRYNRQVMEQYALPNVLEQMAALYRQLLKEE
jgi:glycosyltransferase involved in cell wall biosynthesis